MTPAQSTLRELSSSSATFSQCRKYRYELWRGWDNSKPYCQFIGLNPSTADETLDDPTIRRCIAFAKSWGYGALCMTNLFAFRATQPEDMKRETSPVGPDNGITISKIASLAGVVVCAWGKDGRWLAQDWHVSVLLRNIGKPRYMLKLNKDGTPAHPLYLKSDLKPQLFL